VPVSEAGPISHRKPFAVSFRRFVLLIFEIGILYFLVWAPWRTNPASFCLFFGAGMIQISATYVSELKSTTLGDVLLSLFVMLAALGVLLAEFFIGWHSKSWWLALSLPILPFFLAAVWFKRHASAPPFFAGALLVVLALLLRIFT
jgi:hypothetical protein